MRASAGAPPRSTSGRPNGDAWLPAGLTYVDSWIEEESLDRCFQLMETEDPRLLDEWIARWSDLAEFEVVPVITSTEAAARSSAAGQG